MIITLLCKVVDNFGDIGVVFRLANRLSYLLNNQSEKNSLNVINLVVDDLVSFNRINNQIKTDINFQIFNKINIIFWKDYDFCYEYFKKDDGINLGVVVECFQCGRPDWMEKILFEEKLQRTVHTVMVDYLTAEDYAESFHCLKSLTRSGKVTKVNFMPGFTKKTGGLIIDESWERLEPRDNKGPVLIFTYERDWTPLINALALYKKTNPSKNILLAQGRGKQSVEEAAKNKLDMKVLDFINQNEWDDVMKSCSILFIRGEESMSRACLSGIPFVWHAYPQSDEYQLVKVQALLKRMQEYFTESDFKILESVWLDFNTAESDVDSKSMQNHIYDFLINADNLAAGFEKFATDLRKNGDLGTNLMTFIKNIDII